MRLAEPQSSGKNHALAPRMCWIAAISFNVSVACMYGTFGVLLEAVERSLNVTRAISSLGFALAVLGIAVTSPMVGALTARFSVRTLMIAGALMETVAYVVLSVSPNIILNFLAYGLLIGPGLCLTGMVLPSALVTRWYVANRGRALGLVFLPLGLTILPILSAAALKHVGLSNTYLLLAGLSLILTIPMAFIVEFPPSAEDETAASKRASKDGALSIVDLLRHRQFWVLSLAYAAIMMISTIVSAFLVAMTKDWGLDATRAASLLSISSFAGMGGAIGFGMLADRLGGVKVLVLLCVDTAILWGLLLLQPSYVLLVPLVALIGLHGAGAMGVYAVSLSESFGQGGFARAMGLGGVIILPFSICSVPIAAGVYTATGSFAPAIIGMIAFLILAALFAATARKPAPAMQAV